MPAQIFPPTQWEILRKSTEVLLYFQKYSKLLIQECVTIHGEVIAVQTIIYLLLLTPKHWNITGRRDTVSYCLTSVFCHLLRENGLFH